jgi:hypothetical protein
MAVNPAVVDEPMAGQRETAWNRQGTNVLKRTEGIAKCPPTEVGFEMAGSYAFGPFRLDISEEILFRGAEPLPVGRRAAALLRKLLEQPGAPVSKDALLEAAWPGMAVEESNLTVQIAALRRVLASTPGAPVLEVHAVGFASQLAGHRGYLAAFGVLMRRRRKLRCGRELGRRLHGACLPFGANRPDESVAATRQRLNPALAAV